MNKMGEKQHSYSVGIKWTGNTGVGTLNYQSYQRDHVISAENKVDIEGSSDVCFRGNETKYNPEELLVASLASCHMLWYLHLCAQAGITVTHYFDHASGTMKESANGGGQFAEVVLHPQVTILQTASIEQAIELHHKAHELCFIANSVNFPVRHVAKVKADVVL
jgi:organic hydroperoxide reductase OsmC/OhrA